jgi:glucan phosphoethanolaminetransferase (alkaline phosphatase superfamily)
VTVAVRRMRQRSHVGLTQRALGVAGAAALFVDGFVHFQDAHFYDSVAGSVVSQGMLFRAEAVVATLLGLGLLVWPRMITWIAALLVLASAFGAVMLYRYVNIGALGPLPNMYEPTWVSPGKLDSAWAEGVGVAISILGLFVSRRAYRRNAESIAQSRRHEASRAAREAA